MITLVNQGKNINTPVQEYRGLSTDTKPTDGVVNGSSFIEIDTGSIYFYDAENYEWVLFGGGNGGGGNDPVDDPNS